MLDIPGLPCLKTVFYDTQLQHCIEFRDRAYGMECGDSLLQDVEEEVFSIPVPNQKLCSIPGIGFYSSHHRGNYFYYILLLLLYYQSENLGTMFVHKREYLSSHTVLEKHK